MQNPFQTDANMDAHMMDVGEAAERSSEEKPELDWNCTSAPTSFEPRTASSVSGQRTDCVGSPARPAVVDVDDGFLRRGGRRIGHLRRNQLSAVGASRFAVGVTAPLIQPSMILSRSPFPNGQPAVRWSRCICSTDGKSALRPHIFIPTKAKWCRSAHITAASAPV